MFPNEEEAKKFYGVTLSEADISTPFLTLNINGKEIQWSNNNNMDAYLEGDKVLKGMWRFNVSQIELHQKFDIEIATGDRLFNTFAIFDDKDNNLDVLNTDMRMSGSGKSTNSFEFIKGNADMKYITLVPIKFTQNSYADTKDDSILQNTKLVIFTIEI